MVLAELHRHARTEAGRVEELPSMIVIDSHLARGGSRGGVTFHDRGGPYGRTNGANRVVALDVTGLPLAGVVVPASTSENHCVEALLTELHRTGQDGRLELVLVDRGVSARAARRLSKVFGVEVRRVGWDTPQLDENGTKVFRPIAHAWRVEVAHGNLGWSRRLAKSFENTTESATGWLQLAAARAAGTVVGMRIYRVDHVQLAMPPGGEESAVEFYEGLLGLPRIPKPPHLEVRGGCWFSNGDVALHLGIEDDFRPARKAHPALLVEDLAALEELLRAGGAEVYRDQPLDGFDRCYVDGPFGNRIGLMEPV